jgi:stage III sporulation protein AB
MLGQTDINGQISKVKLTQEFIEKQIEEATVDENKNQKLYKSLGVLCGLTLVIILI